MSFQGALGPDNTNSLSSADVFDLSTGEWRRGPPLDAALSYPASVALGSSFVVLGGLV